MEKKINDLKLAKGQRIRTAGVSYEVTGEATIPADFAEVKPQGTRLLKASCPGCGYTVRITQKWLTKAGTPTCPADGNRLEVEEKAEKAATKAAPTYTVPDGILPESAQAEEPIIPEDEPEEEENPESPLAVLLADL